MFKRFLEDVKFIADVALKIVKAIFWRFLELAAMGAGM